MPRHLKKPKTILFDATPMVGPGKSGVGYYTHGIIAALVARHPEIHFVGHYFARGALTEGLPTAPNISYRSTSWIPRQAVNAIRRLGVELTFEVFTRERGDFIIFPAFLTMPSRYKTPMTVIIPDLSYHDVPETVSPRNRKDLQRFVPGSIRRSSFVTTISSATAERLQDVYGTGGDALVTHIPPVTTTDVSAADATAARKSLGITKKYVLFIGTIEPRKNIRGMVAAYRALSDELRATYSLVLAGGKGWNDADVITAIDNAKRDGFDIITPGYVDDTQRAALYEGASLFLFPTLYEGFGMPPLEAMSYGLPVICSDLAVLREVCGDAARYCDPDDPKAIADAITDVLASKAVRERLIASGRQQLMRYDWQSIADDLYERIESSLNES